MTSTPASSGSPEGPAGAAARDLALTAIGGGTGLAVLLSGLKHHVGTGGIGRLTAVVTVSDDGGSSGRLRRDFEMLPPGDIRNCIVALADDEALLSRLFQYRFPNGGALTGHSFGNLFLTALTGITGDFYQAVLTAEAILSVRGRILPATLTPVQLRARGRSGTLYEGESAIGTSGEELDTLELVPGAPPAFPQALDALATADLILLGPGSLYTSIIANLLIPAIRRTVAASPAKVVLLMNLMTQPGETDGMDAAAHLEAIRRYAGEDAVDLVLVNDAPLPQRQVERYHLQAAEPVTVDRGRLEELGVGVVAADLLAEGDYLRHDPAKLARAVLSVGHGEEPGS